MRSPQSLMHAMPTPCSARRVTAPCWPGDGWSAGSRAPTTVWMRPGVTHASGAGTHTDRLVVNGAPQADVTRRCGNNRDQQGFPFTERWEGSRDWKPDVPRGSYRPDRLIIDRPGQCEVRCERVGREYRCREHRCEGSRSMDFADVEQRWQQYVNEFFAE
jgi:hypothetical protein